MSAIADPAGARTALWEYARIRGFPKGGIPPVSVWEGGAAGYRVGLDKAKPAWLGIAWERIEDASFPWGEGEKENKVPVVQWSTMNSLEAGFYPAKVVAIEEVPEHDDYSRQLKFTFEVLDKYGEGTGRTVFGWTSYGYGPKHKLFEWTSAILGRKAPKEAALDTDRLLGRSVDIEMVRHTRKDGTLTTKLGKLYLFNTMANRPDDEDDDN